MQQHAKSIEPLSAGTVSCASESSCRKDADPGPGRCDEASWRATPDRTADQSMDKTIVTPAAISVRGAMLKIAALTAEPYEDVADPQAVVRSFAGSRVSVDLFTFIQRPPDTTPKFNYAVEWDNMAVLEVTDYDHWWTRQVNDKTRNLVRKAEKKGVVVKQVPFDEALQRGIAEIYNETPIRQGRQFWHYGKDAETVRRENEEYADRSEYFAAFHGDEIIGFMRLVHDEKLTNIMYILSKIAHREKAPNNALIAHAVKRCAAFGRRDIVYAKYVYGKKGEDKLTDFKRHNGFRKIDIPRYYIPLTLKGRIALQFHLHHGVQSVIPQRLYTRLVALRNSWYGAKAS